MNEVAIWGVMLAGGVVLGLLYFALLWFTVDRLTTVRNPGLWVMASFLVRMATLLTGLYLLAGDRADRLLACLVGVVFARIMVVRRVRAQATTEAS